MSKDPFRLTSYHFDLPKELIAQTPSATRDQSRLMVIERATGRITEMVFRDLIDFLNDGDMLICNDTKVIPARLIGKRDGGGESEVFLIRRLEETLWEALVRPGRKLHAGSRVTFDADFFCEVLEVLPNGNRFIRFHCQGDFDLLLKKYGQMPLPPYIQREAGTTDADRYQTVYAAHSGAVAAPTAGLHFTREMLEMLMQKGVYQTTVTLHVGLGTFRPVQTEDIRQHQMHIERLIISSEAATQINQRPFGKRRICVGTTSCRALETASTMEGVIAAGEYDTNIFIYPGYRFKHVQALLTNFHLPGSSLLMLVSAFAGYDLTMEAYAKAIKERFRFFSYGDAMLIL